MTCIVIGVKKAHDAKVLSFQKELKAIASASRKQLSRDEIARRLEVIEIGWRELDLKEIRDQVKQGHMTRPFYVEPEYVEVVEVVAREQDYDETGRPRRELSIRAGSGVREDQAKFSNAALNSASRPPSPISSASSSSSGSIRSRLPVRKAPLIRPKHPPS